MKKRLAAVCLCASVLLSGCSFSYGSSYRVSQKIHKEYPASDLRQVSIHNISGPVEVEGWNRSQVSIDALVHAGDDDAMHRIAVNVTKRGDELIAETQYQKRSFVLVGLQDNGAVDYVVHVPTALAVSVTNVSGSVMVKDIHSDVGVTSISGAARADSVDGNLDINTTSGRIRAAVIAMTPGRRIELHSVSGSIDLSVPKKAAANISASSVSGSFDSNFGLGTGHHIEGAINGGGASISFSTVSGGMTLAGK